MADACAIAQTLLAVTLSASASVDIGDWETAGQLLRRREQLLTQLEGCANLADAVEMLHKVQRAERDLASGMEIATREALNEMETARDARSARRAYEGQRTCASFIERVG